jgi:two-component system, chemotaxis family, sensor kinase CheA
MDISHLKQKFIDEANDLLNNLDSDLLELESNPLNKPNIDQIFRSMHTIKGASGMYGYNKITEITHELETLFDLAREQKITITKKLIDLTFSTSDHIRNLLNDPDFNNNENIKNHSILIENISTFLKSLNITHNQYNHKKQENLPPTDKPTCIQTWQILLYPDEEMLFRGINLTYIIGDLFTLGKCIIHSNAENDNITFWSIFIITEKGKDAIEDIIIFISDYCKLNKIADFDIFNEDELLRKNKEEYERENNFKLSSEKENVNQQFSAPTLNTNPINIKNSKFQKSSRIHVDASKLDTLMNLVTELVTTKSELLLSIQNNTAEKTSEAAEKIDKLAKLFSENALSIRLVSLQEMIFKYQRLIRDLSGQLGKKINFSIKGEDTELDKNIVDIIAEPIMHLIRNCVDHGLETPDKRVEYGKEETGNIFFNAFESGNNVYIKIGDDGVGINTDYVYNKAIEKGFIQPGAQLTEKEIFDLIFLPGFSTAQNLTEISGRGVGMDIVRKKISEIRGEVVIESTQGKGTTFTIKLQQTISIIDTLLIVSDGITYAIPIGDVECCDLASSEILNYQNALVEYKENLIPFINLRNKFNSQTLPPEKIKLIIINKQEYLFAIVADDIIGQHQSVIKPVGETFSGINFLTGASILGDGTIALLIDTDKLKTL